jgi:hypothetical protein
VSSTALSDLITSLGEKLTHFNMSSNKMAGLPFVFKALSVSKYPVLTIGSGINLYRIYKCLLD